MAERKPFDTVESMRDMEQYEYLLNLGHEEPLTEREWELLQDHFITRKVAGRREFTTAESSPYRVVVLRDTEEEAKHEISTFIIRLDNSQTG